MAGSILLTLTLFGLYNSEINNKGKSLARVIPPLQHSSKVVADQNQPAVVSVEDDDVETVAVIRETGDKERY